MSIMNKWVPWNCSFQESILLSVLVSDHMCSCSRPLCNHFKPATRSESPVNRCLYFMFHFNHSSPSLRTCGCHFEKPWLGYYWNIHFLIIVYVFLHWTINRFPSKTRHQESVPLFPLYGRRVMSRESNRPAAFPHEYSSTWNTYGFLG